MKKVAYFIFLIITTIILWILVLIGGAFLAGQEANSLYSIIGLPALLIPVWLYKTQTTLKSLSKVLLFSSLGFVLLMPLSYVKLIGAAYNSPPGAEGLGAAIGLPILTAIFLVYIAGAAIVNLILALIAWLIGRND